MRILMIAPEPFLEPRGTPFSVYHRIQALIELGHEVDLVTYPLGREVKLRGLNICRTPLLPFINGVRIGPSLAKVPLDALLFLTAMRRLSKRRYYYIHTHEEAGAMGVILGAIFGCKHLYDMHSDLAQQMSNFSFTRSRLLIRAVAAVQRWIVRKADVVIAICSDLKKAAEQMAPGKPIYLIENVAVDESLPAVGEEEVERLRERLQLSDGPVLLYTGTLEHYQGIDLLLQSAVQVLQEMPEAQYVLVGGHTPQIRRYKKKAQKLGIEQSVHFLGQRPVEEMPQYTALADILLSPRSEGTNTPLKLYTYLRSGKPVLATSIYSHTQLLTPETALLVEPTAEDLASGSLELLRDPQKAREIGERAKKLADEQYSWPAFLEKNRRAYEH
ncbi:MAG: glycosyltransferase family 4 protein, partial [Ktedonobacteraceae bacterium]|nr:glycosyltransferase family 4 protein [Ktedonobacteraceae bacterium]